MKTRVGWAWVPVVLALASSPSCEAGDEGGDVPDAAADAAADAVPDASPDVDTVTGATKRVLDSSHGGWQKAACWTCHTADDHNDGKDPYLCVGCHGTNGAPDGHGGASPCSGCHAPAPHGDEGFPDPLSCRGCHGQ